jgi:hypothetical protein
MRMNERKGKSIHGRERGVEERAQRTNKKRKIYSERSCVKGREGVKEEGRREGKKRKRRRERRRGWK